MNVTNWDETFAREVREELEGNILPFWMQRMPDQRGGFYGRVDGYGNLHEDAVKGSVPNSRILWAFSAAYRLLRKPEYLEMADRAKNYLLDRLMDNKYGGVYWTADADGNRLDTRKQVYAMGYAIYGLSEYAYATKDEYVLRYAANLFECVEKYCYDEKNGGYHDALTRNWEPMEDARMNEKEPEAQKTLGTHLHLLESYINLYRVWKNAGLKERIVNLLQIFADKIYQGKGHLGLHFDAQWKLLDQDICYGDVMEASWILLEAANLCEDVALMDKVKKMCAELAEAGLEGLQKDGSMAYGCKPGKNVDTERYWWVQAETVLGALWMWKYSGNVEGWDIAFRCWDYIKANMVDQENGEWYWSVNADGTPNKQYDKAGLWKSPCHNARMCLEIIGWNK